MAPKPKPARFVFAVGMGLTVLAGITWAMAQPSLSLCTAQSFCLCTKAPQLTCPVVGSGSQVKQGSAGCCAHCNQNQNCPCRRDSSGAIKWTRLSCRMFAANSVRLQLHALAYNLGNFLRTLATPEPIKDWSLTSLKDKLIKIGAKVVSHGRYVIFQMGRGRHRTANVPRDFAADRGATAAATTSASVRRSMSCIQDSRQKECVQMPGKRARSDPRAGVRVTRGAVAVSTSRLSARGPGKREH